MSKQQLTGALALLLIAVSGGAAACVFGTVYNLPIPFGMYATGATGALVASFAIVGFVLKGRPADVAGMDAGAQAYASEPIALLSARILNYASWLSVAMLALTMASGVFGTPNRLANFGMTFFWIIFALGLNYVTAIIGDVYELINPWRKLCNVVAAFAPNAMRGRFSYPQWLGYYPALALYMGFVWIELFGEIQPVSLTLILASYLVLNVVGTSLFGTVAWFRYGELFSVFFRLIGKMAPIEYVENADVKYPYRIRLRKPFVGLLKTRADHISLLLFIVFMLSSTAFDGAHDTLPWVGIFWKGIYPTLDKIFHQPYFFFLTIYYAWQSATLILSPLLYVVIYVALLWLAKRIARSNVPLKALVLRFAFTLIPIAFVYNLTHYFTDLLLQGVLIVRMASDPFNLGWNLFGTATWLSDPIIPDAGAIWHAQVAFILFGHIVSVYLAHVEALKVFSNRRHAVASQLPMLVLMVLLTTIGLWILSLPISAGQVIDPTLPQLTGSQNLMPTFIPA